MENLITTIANVLVIPAISIAILKYLDNKLDKRLTKLETNVKDILKQISDDSSQERLLREIKKTYNYYYKRLVDNNKKYTNVLLSFESMLEEIIKTLFNNIEDISSFEECMDTFLIFIEHNDDIDREAKDRIIFELNYFKSSVIDIILDVSNKKDCRITSLSQLLIKDVFNTLK